jgi:hypothetical protein
LQDYLAQDLNMQLEKLTNQVRFVQMIIKKELNVSGRKKNDIIKDLKSKNFKSFPKIVKKEDTEIVEEGNEEQEEVETGSDNGYDYLLSVQTLHDVLANIADADLLAYKRTRPEIVESTRRQRVRIERTPQIERQGPLEPRPQ